MEALEWLAGREDPITYERQIRRMTMLVLARADHMPLNSSRDYDQYPDALAFRIRGICEKLLAHRIESLKRTLKELITALPYAFSQGVISLRQILWGIAEEMDERTLRTAFARELRSALHGAALSKQDLYLVRAYRQFLETGEPGEALGKRWIVMAENDRHAREETRTYLEDPGMHREIPQIYDEIIQLEEVLTILFEGTSRSDIFRKWLKQPVVAKYPAIRDGLHRILLMTDSAHEAATHSPFEKFRTHNEHLMWISETRGLLNKILDDPETPTGDVFDLYHLDRSLGQTLSLLLSDFYHSWNAESLDRLLVMRESADLLSGMLHGLFTNGFISRYVAQWAYLLADPELTLSQLADVVRALHRDVETDFNNWQKRYYDEGHALFDGDSEKIERVLARLRRERFATRAIIDLTEQLRKLVDMGISQMPEQWVRPAEAATVTARRAANPYAEIVHFDDDVTSAETDMQRGRMLYGGKANYLIQMRALGLSVPSGFVIPYYVGRERWHIRDGMNFRKVILEHLSKLERAWSAKTGVTCRFGSTSSADAEPLFLSIRSGSVFVMPGVFETAVALGFTRGTLDWLVAKRGAKAAYSEYMNFIESIAIGLGVSREKLENRIQDFLGGRQITNPGELTEHQTQLLAEHLLDLLREEAVFDEFDRLLDSPSQQLFLLIAKIFESWNSPKAIRYRHEKKYSEDWYTPVTIQAYVFGDADERSGTGIVRTHDLVTGENRLSGDWNPMTEGFYHVQGRVNPLSVEHDLKHSLPDACAALENEANLLARYFGGPQLVEYTIQSGKVWLLQTQRDRGGISETSFAAADFSAVRPVADGINVFGSGAFRGIVVFMSEEILLGSVIRALQENPTLDGIILLKAFITPEDSPDLINARSVLESFGKHVAVLTSRGGVTSHAAVVANMEKIPAIVGAEELDLRDESGETVAIFRQDHAPQHQVLRKLEALTLDLDSGKVYDGALPPCDPSWVGSNPPS